MERAYCKRGDHAQAVEAFRKATGLQPMNSHVYCEVAMVHHALGNVGPVCEIIECVWGFAPEINQQRIEATGPFPEAMVRR